MTADFEADADAPASDLDDDVEALKDLPVAIFEDVDRVRSYTLTLDAPNAWRATETTMARLAEAGAARSRLRALDILTTAAFDAREGFSTFRDLTPRLHAASARGAFLAVQEAEARGADDNKRAAILKAYAYAWERLDAWLRDQSGEPYTPASLPGTPPSY